MRKKWEVLKKELVYGPGKRKIENWQVKIGGQEKNFTIINIDDFVLVFGIDKENNVLLINQFFISAEKYTNSLVAGMIESGDNALQTAKRELLEEAGYDAEEYIYLGSILKGKYSTGSTHYVLAKNVFKVGDQDLEDGEDIEVFKVSLEKFKEMLKNGELHDGYCVACAYWALNYLKLL